MFSNILSSIENVSVYAIISLVLFVSFFTGIIVWVVKADKEFITKMENLPLEESDKQEF